MNESFKLLIINVLSDIAYLSSRHIYFDDKGIS
jgi:hypothetical protein